MIQNSSLKKLKSLSSTSNSTSGANKATAVSAAAVAASLSKAAKAATKTITATSPTATALTRVKTYSIIFILIMINLIALCSLSSEAKAANYYQVKIRRAPPQQFSASLGSSIIIECDANGSPPPTIHWLKNGKRLIQNDFDENSLESEAPGPVDDVKRMALGQIRSRLFIDCASYEDEATYTCVAENAYSRVSAHTKLTLFKPAEVAAAAAEEEADGGSSSAAATGGIGAPASIAAVPQCISRRVAALAAGPGANANTNTPADVDPNQQARIHMWTTRAVEIEKNNLLLYCRSNGRKGVTWTLPNSTLVKPDQRDKYEILETGDLLIKDLHWDEDNNGDNGTYICTVSDEQSSDSISTYVYVASAKAQLGRGLGAT